MSEDKVTAVKVLGAAKATDNPEVKAKDGQIIDMHRTAVRKTGIIFASDEGAGTYVTDPIAVEVTKRNEQGEETKIRGTITMEAEMGPPRSNLTGTAAAKQSFEPNFITFMDPKHNTEVHIPIKNHPYLKVGVVPCT
jgi:hypothetical protein